MTIEMLRSRFAALSRRDMHMGAALLVAAAALLYLVQTPASSAVIEPPMQMRAQEEDETREIVGLDARAAQSLYLLTRDTRRSGAYAGSVTASG